MISKKVRKHSGRYTPKAAGTIPNKEKQDVLIQLPEESYDDWIERRDGLRFDPDKKHIRSIEMNCSDKETIKANNEKLKKKEKIRKAKKDVKK